MLLVLAVAVPLSTLHVTAMALAASAVGAVVLEVQVFLGPGVVVRRGRPEIRLGALPLGAWMRCLGALDTEPQDAPGSWHALAAWRRIAVLLAGNVALLVVAAALAGPADALASFVRAPAQLVSLLLDHAGAVGALRAFAAEPFGSRFVATVAAKMAASNLLPLAGVNGGVILRELVPRALRARFDRVHGGVTALVVIVLAIALVAAAARL